MKCYRNRLGWGWLLIGQGNSVGLGLSGESIERDILGSQLVFVF